MVDTRRLTRIGARVVAAYVSKNPVHSGMVPGVVRAVYDAFSGLGMQGSDGPRGAVDGPRETVTTDYIISLEDGRRYKVLTRHLRKLGLTPDTYREKWGLPADYPMTAPSYSKVRSRLAKSSGLGRTAR